MWTWLTSPPVLLAGFLASVFALCQPLRVLTRKIVLFPQRRRERQVGQWVISVIQDITSGKPATPPAGQDMSQYNA